MMHRIFTTFLLVIACSSHIINAQNIWENLSISQSYIQEGKYNEAKEVLDKLPNTLANSSNDTLRLLYSEQRGLVLYSEKKFNECIPFLTKSYELYEKLNVRLQNYLDDILLIAFSYDYLDDDVNAERFYRKALLKSVTANSTNIQAYRSYIYVNLGNIYKTRGDSALAVDCYRKIELTNPDELIEVRGQKWLNDLYAQVTELRESNKEAEAVIVYDKILNEIAERYGTNNRKYIFALYSKAILQRFSLGKYKEAMPLFLEVINKRDYLQEASEEVAGAYCNYALCLAYLDDFTTIEDIIPEATAYLKNVSPELFVPKSLYRFIGNGAFWTQNYSKAIQFYEKYILDEQIESGRSNMEIPNQLALSYIFSNKPDKAENVLVSFLQQYEKQMISENDVLLPTIYHNLGRAMMLQGRNKEALTYLTRSSELQEVFNGEVSEKTKQYIKECLE